MKKTLVLLVLVILLLVTAAPAFAKWSWCAADPEIVLPDGQGSLSVWVGLPEQYAGTPVTLYLDVPEGAQVINHPGDINVNIVINKVRSDGKHVFARVAENVPVQLSAFYNDEALQVFTFEDGQGLGHWRW